MAALTDTTLAGVSPASVIFKASHVDRNQVGFLTFRPTTSEVSAVNLSIQNQLAVTQVADGAKRRNIKGRAKIAHPRVAVDPVLGEIALDTGYIEVVGTFPVAWTQAQKEHLVKLMSSALLNATIISTVIGNDKPF